jgi:hypothetical protein
MRILIATVSYFISVFAAGFIFGSIRVMLLEPRLGKLLAVMLEFPFMLIVIVISARKIPIFLQAPKQYSGFIVMGLGALVLQQLADLLVGLFLRALTPSEIYLTMLSPQGAVYILMLIAFATMPAIMHRLEKKQTREFAP